MTDDQVQLIANELESVLNRFDLILKIAPDQWAKVEELHKRLSELDTIFGTVAKLAKNMKAIEIFLEQLKKDFPDAEEVIRLEAKCRKYIYGLDKVQ